MGTALIDNENMAGDIESDLLDISDVDNVAFHITSVCGSTGHEGTIKFRQTNVFSKETPTPVAMSVPTVTVSSGSDVEAFVELTELGGRYLQVFYDCTSGDGYLTVRAWRKPPRGD